MLNATSWFFAIKGDQRALRWLIEVYLPDHREQTYWNCVEMCGALDYSHDETTGNTTAVRWLYNECHAPAEYALLDAQKEEHWETARWILVNCDLAVRRVEWDRAAASGALSLLNFKWTPGYGKMATL
ncbi:uncharacterized protein PITG_16222 [Phytophthora infestans T30-4]|uniref:Uncharacterized protein n=1 Tax=Phytophthora infestans (strain T30-4) TaxID=403677 RepID=D0NTE6_PHYIT|nr:uncharacterized protein PITG_16222 [Phytophthora infestans T30-4]EEY64897.1 conserved hypothetical protein [Phytophthora infestans T30-4]|eukprot:XP_002897627.1 conserved hypothetical protein [Phytophthora infestans T30-4]